MCYTCSSSSCCCSGARGRRSPCACVSAPLRLMALFPLSVLRRETWNLNPPEVRNAQLQYAGWGPQGQQLVRNYESNDVPPPGLIAASWRWCFKVKSQAILTVFHLAFWNWSLMESTLKNTKKTQTKINGITNTERIWLCREGNQVQNKCSHASSSACSF